MKYTALFLIAALAVTSAYIQNDAEFDMEPALVETEETRVDFGDLIELMETSSGTAENVKDKIIGFLKKYEKNLKKEQKKHDELHAKNVVECKEEEVFRTKEIKDGSKAAAASYNHMISCEANYNLANSIEKVGKDNLVIVESLLKNAKVRRETEIEVNKRHTKNLEKAIKGIEKCLKFLDELEASVTNRPKKVFLQQVNALLAVTITTGHAEHMIPVYESLAEMTASGSISTSDIDKVRALLEKQSKNFASASTDVAAREIKQAKAYAVEKAGYEAAIARLENQIKVAGKQAEEMDACVKQEKGINELSKNKVKRNTELLSHSLEICEADDKAYAAATANTRREFRLIVQLEKAMVHLAKRYLAAVLPKVGKVIKLAKTKGDTQSKREQYRVCHILKVHNIQDADCDKLHQDIAV